MTIREDAQRIIDDALRDAMPGAAVRGALAQIDFNAAGRLLLVAVGKAAWAMAREASVLLGDQIDEGIVITKYAHAKGDLPRLRIFEAGHPIPDENGFAATAQATQMVKGLRPEDSVLFLLSGGGSALFEQPLIPARELTDITQQLLACGADIVEMNTIRKRLSAVKGGRFAQMCAPAHVYAVVLSDIIGDPLDMIASGPAYPDLSTAEQAVSIQAKYNLRMSDEAQRLLRSEMPKALPNVTTNVAGSVKQLCATAERTCRELKYEPIVLTDCLTCEAREAGRFLAAIARTHQNEARSVAYLAGGETVVRLTGRGKGGRNQEIALAAAEGIAGCRDTCAFSFGSDGTDGPTDAAGGYADGETAKRLERAGVDIWASLSDNDAYHALKTCDGLIVTGPTGTNVNDLSVILIRR